MGIKQNEKMTVKIIAFGKIAEMAAKTKWSIQHVHSLEELRTILEKEVIGLKGMKYQLSVDRKIATTTTEIKDGSEVALLPPFSGG